MGLFKRRKRQRDRYWDIKLKEDSPLRAVDPRTKLLLVVALSLAVMLPPIRLAVAVGIYLTLLLWARLFKLVVRQVWRIKWVLLIIFIGGAILVSVEHAIAISVRLALLTSSFTLLFATTSPDELRLALEWMRVPYRYAFTITLAIQSLTLLDDEWRAIREAQQSRSAWDPGSDRKLLDQVRDMVSLAVPSIVMTTRRAWSITEAAYARGFDSPYRRPFVTLSFRTLDIVMLCGIIVLSSLFIVLR